MHSHVCKNIENLIQKICTPKNNLRSETMKTYIMASIFTDKKSLEEFKNNGGNQGVGWIAGVPDVKYWRKEKNQIIERISDADSRWDNFPETIWNVLYTNDHRYYTENLKKCLEVDEVYKYPVTRIQVLLSEKISVHQMKFQGWRYLRLRYLKKKQVKNLKLILKKCTNILLKINWSLDLKLMMRERKEIGMDPKAISYRNPCEKRILNHLCM